MSKSQKSFQTKSKSSHKSLEKINFKSQVIEERCCKGFDAVTCGFPPPKHQRLATQGICGSIFICSLTHTADCASPLLTLNSSPRSLLILYRDRYTHTDWRQLLADYQAPISQQPRPIRHPHTPPQLPRMQIMFNKIQIKSEVLEKKLFQVSSHWRKKHIMFNTVQIKSQVLGKK